jgi:hypothetical protein
MELRDWRIIRAVFVATFVTSLLIILYALYFGIYGQYIFPLAAIGIYSFTIAIVLTVALSWYEEKEKQ